MLNPGWVVAFLSFSVPYATAVSPLTAAAEERSTNGRCPPQSFSGRQSGGTCDNLKCPSCCGERIEEVGGFANRSSENRSFSWVRNLQSSTIVQFAHGDSSNYVVRTLAFKTLSSLDPSVSVTQINTFRCEISQGDKRSPQKQNQQQQQQKYTDIGSYIFLRFLYPNQERLFSFPSLTFSCKCTPNEHPLPKSETQKDKEKFPFPCDHSIPKQGFNPFFLFSLVTAGPTPLHNGR